MGVLCSYWLSLPSMQLLRVMSHIGDRCFPLVYTYRSGYMRSRSGFLWPHSGCLCCLYAVVVCARKAVQCDVSYRGNGFGCCVYVVVLSAHEVVLCDISYRGKPLLTRGLDSSFHY